MSGCSPQRHRVIPIQLSFLSFSFFSPPFFFLTLGYCFPTNQWEGCRHRALFPEHARRFPQILTGVRVSRAFLSDCWILQIPLPVDKALSLLTVPGMDLVEKGAQRFSTVPSPGRTAISHPTYWSTKQKCERKIKIVHIQEM